MADAFPHLRVAAVHAAPVYLDRDATIDKVCATVAEAASDGAKLVVFPECFLPGYPFWIWSHTPAQGAPLFAELFANAVELPSAASERIGKAARDARAWVVIGLNEREGGTLYNTLAYFDDHGRLLARHRKLQPTNAERIIWGRGDGRDVFVLDTPHGRLGGLICFEHTMDLNRYALAALGEQIHIAAWPAISACCADPNSTNFDNLTETAVKYHALAAQAFVVCVQGRIDEAIVEKLKLADRPGTLRVGGGMTGVVGPDSNWIAGPHRDDEKIIYADIDVGLIRFGKYFADSAGHYARPDVFNFGVNRLEQSPLAGSAAQPSDMVIRVAQPNGGETAGD